MPPDAPTPTAKPGVFERLRAEVRRHALAYGILLAFLVIGPVLVHLIFPDVSPLLGVVGGLAFGVYAALSAVPDRFFE
jgi:hypothetical protein